MNIPIYQIDAFTDERFRGNPAAVCILEGWLPDKVLQSIAEENNLAETAFVVRKNNNIELRWFTPALEVDLCGHATLATAYAFKEHLDYKEDEISFKTKSGILEVIYGGDMMSMIFPRREGAVYSGVDEIAAALGAIPTEVFKARDIMAVFEDEGCVRALEPNFDKVKKLECLGVIATAPGKNADFVSRYFAPQAGINEDPVTGSAHTTLIPYWSARLRKKQLAAMQISRRGGKLFCEDLVDKVKIAGKAVTYLTGTIAV